MRAEKSIEISVRPVFAGKRSAEQVFIELIRHRSAGNFRNGLEPFMENGYNKDVVFSGVSAPEGGLTL